RPGPGTPSPGPGRGSLRCCSPLTSFRLRLGRLAEGLDPQQLQQVGVLGLDLGRQLVEHPAQAEDRLGLGQLERLGDNGTIGSDTSGNCGPEFEPFPRSPGVPDTTPIQSWMSDRMKSKSCSYTPSLVAGTGLPSSSSRFQLTSALANPENRASTASASSSVSSEEPETSLSWSRTAIRMSFISRPVDTDLVVISRPG